MEKNLSDGEIFKLSRLYDDCKSTEEVEALYEKHLEEDRIKNTRYGI